MNGYYDYGYGYDYGYRGPSTFSIILLIALLIFGIATMWRIFTKAGVSGWKCLIPIYSTYQQWEIGWEGSKFIALFFGGLGLGLLSLIFRYLGQIGVIIYSLLSIAWGIYTIVMGVKMSIRFAHRFGKSTAFGVVGLIFFSVIGYAILAWGSADYNAARDLGDGILRSDAELSQGQEESSDYWNRIADK